MQFRLFSFFKLLSLKNNLFTDNCLKDDCLILTISTFVNQNSLTVKD